MQGTDRERATGPGLVRDNLPPHDVGGESREEIWIVGIGGGKLMDLMAKRRLLAFRYAGVVYSIGNTRMSNGNNNNNQNGWRRRDASSER